MDKKKKPTYGNSPIRDEDRTNNDDYEEEFDWEE